MHETSAVNRATVLIIDDEPMLRSLLTHVLFGAGFAVLEAEHGARALRIADEFDGYLSLVITDIEMPVMDGREFARAFRTRYPSVPILFITGGGGQDSSLARSLAPWGDLLTKPFYPDALLETVARMLTLHPAAGQIPA